MAALPLWWLRWWRICLQCGRPGFLPWVEKIPWRREWQPMPVLRPGEFHGQRSLAGYSPWGHKELAMTEWLTYTHTHTHTHTYAFFHLCTLVPHPVVHKLVCWVSSSIWITGFLQIPKGRWGPLQTLTMDGLWWRSQERKPQEIHHKTWTRLCRVIMIIYWAPTMQPPVSRFLICLQTLPWPSE